MLQWRVLGDKRGYFYRDIRDRIISLRQKIETEEIAWLATSDPWAASVYPDDNYAIDDDAERTVNNQYGQVKVGGELIEPVSLVEGSINENSGCGDPNWACKETRRHAKNIPLPNDKMIHWKIVKREGQKGNGENLWFDSYVRAKLRRFRKKDGIWTKHKGNMSVQIFGKVYRNYGYSICIPENLYDTFDKTKSYKRKYIRAEKQKWDRYTWLKACETGATFNVDGYIFTKWFN